MSGITPVLDTLLPQVLGRRVDIPLPKDLNPPVAAAVPVQGAQAVQDDSRLEPRTPAQAYRVLAGQAAVSGAGPFGEAEGVRQTPLPPPSLSTSTTFSGGARTIAELLRRFPASPSSIAPAQPLLDMEVSQPPDAEQIASRLQDSIRLSGLFFESHVARWFRGELPLEALRQEPQMRGMSSGRESAPSATELPLEGTGTRQMASQPVGVSEILVGLREMLGGGGADGAERSGDERAPVEGARAANAQGAESLAVLVRHQLELLATPQLRWEGNVLAGVFMALTIEAPPAHEWQADEGSEGAAGERAAQGEWRARVGLSLLDHGALEAVISLQGTQLAVALQTDSASLRGYVEATRGALQERLAGCGFSSVQLRLLDAAGMVVDD